MKIVLGFLFERMTDPLGLPIGVLEEYIVLLILGSVAYLIAYVKVGELYHEGSITSKTEGSLMHWSIRVIVFFAIWAVLYCLIWLGKLIVRHWQIALTVFVMMLLAGVILYTAFQRKNVVSEQQVPTHADRRER